MQITEREKIVLAEVVQRFIGSATPVSSSLIAQNRKLNMSPATIRNILSSLEQKGYLEQPHTSAGRVPNTAGYRAYVDHMMKKARLSSEERESICQSVDQDISDLEPVLKAVSSIISNLTRQLAIIVSPRLEEGIFQRMELISLSSEKLLVIMTIRSGLVKTLHLEVESEVPRDRLQLVCEILNERLSGLELSQIRRQFSSIFKDVGSERTGIVRRLQRDADRVFDFGSDFQLYFMGTHHFVRKPEFTDPSAVSTVVELVENQDIIVYLDNQDQAGTSVNVRIGDELEEQRIRGCSIISASYQIGETSGTLGVLGPTRMNYSRLVPLIDFAASMITKAHGRH